MKQAYQTTEALQDIKVVKEVRWLQVERRTEVVIQQHNGGGKSKQLPKREKLAFPVPGSMKANDDAFFCQAERVLALYNKLHGVKRQKMTSAVKGWFEQEARRVGWGEATFLSDIQTGRSAGCMLRVSMGQGASHVTSH